MPIRIFIPDSSGERRSETDAIEEAKRIIGSNIRIKKLKRVQMPKGDGWLVTIEGDGDDKGY